jgi:Transposase IS116/IS110/IS902 family
MAMIRHYDERIAALEQALISATKATAASRDFVLLKTVPGIGLSLGMTILHEIGDINRFPSVKDFLSYCRLVKGTVASAGKIKGLRGAKLGNPGLGLWRVRRHRQTRSPHYQAPGPAPGGPVQRQQVQSQHRPGHQDRARRLFHAQRRFWSIRPIGKSAENWRREPATPWPASGRPTSL